MKSVALSVLLVLAAPAGAAKQAPGQRSLKTARQKILVSRPAVLRDRSVFSVGKRRTRMPGLSKVERHDLVSSMDAFVPAGLELAHFKDELEATSHILDRDDPRPPNDAFLGYRYGDEFHQRDAPRVSFNGSRYGRYRYRLDTTDGGSVVLQQSFSVDFKYPLTSVMWFLRDRRPMKHSLIERFTKLAHDSVHIRERFASYVATETPDVHPIGIDIGPSYVGPSLSASVSNAALWKHILVAVAGITRPTTFTISGGKNVRAVDIVVRPGDDKATLKRKLREQMRKSPSKLDANDEAFLGA